MVCLCLFFRNRYVNNIPDMTYGDEGQCFNQDYFQLFALFTIQNHTISFWSNKECKYTEERCFLQVLYLGSCKKKKKVQNAKQQQQTPFQSYLSKKEHVKQMWKFLMENANPERQSFTLFQKAKIVLIGWPFFFVLFYCLSL